MADLPPYSDAGNDTSMGSDRETATGTPRWVKVFAIITIVVARAARGVAALDALTWVGSLHQFRFSPSMTFI
jgi:hypothetical protein